MIAAFVFVTATLMSIAESYHPPFLHTALDKTHSPRRDFLKTVSALTAASFLRPEISNAVQVGGKPVYGSDKDIMVNKSHGTTENPIQANLKYNVDAKTADKICSYNRHFAEYSGYFTSSKSYLEALRSADGPITYYDSVSGKPLFIAPIGRTMESFFEESNYHGWPSFRDEEVVWENVRVLKNSGETVSTVGTHLGHNLPDKKGNRYCINLVSVSGNPSSV